MTNGGVPPAEFDAVRDVVLNAMMEHTAVGFPPRCQCGLRYDIDQSSTQSFMRYEILGHSATMVADALARHVGLR